MSAITDAPKARQAKAAKNSRPDSSTPAKQKTVSKNGVWMGRPSSYQQDIAEKVCEFVATGGFLTQLRANGLPAYTTVARWLNDREDFRDAFARAREVRAETFADQIVEIADTEEDPQRARVRVDARKFVASKLLPRIYGDNQRVEVEHGVSQTAARVLMELTQRANERKRLDAKVIDVTPLQGTAVDAQAIDIDSDSD